MSFQTPVSIVSTQLVGLGTLDGFHYANGVEQYCGIPYASLSKRWTRSVLKTSWENGYHNGTQLGWATWSVIPDGILTNASVTLQK